MGRRKKVVVLTDKEWLNTEPLETEVALSPVGGRHIPIDKLRPLLDRLNACVTNYKSSSYRDNSTAGIVAYGSLELTVTIDGLDRTVTGAYNLFVSDSIGGFWNGTLKSECVKNAASELGKRLGRDLNKDLPETFSEPKLPKIPHKPIADEKIMIQFLSAKEKGDEKAMTLLSNIYTIKNQ